MAEHLGYQEEAPSPQHAHLSGRMFVWIEEVPPERVVFYDFDNDEGMSLDLDEWRTAVAWWVSLDATTASE